MIVVFSLFGLPPLRDWIASFDISPTDEKVSTPIQRIVSQFLDEVVLVVAGVFETGFSIGLKYSEGFTRLWPSVATAIMIVAELGPGGGGDAESAAGHGVCGMDRDWRGGYSGAGHCAVWGVCGLSRLACLGLIVSGILGLKFLGE